LSIAKGEKDMTIYELIQKKNKANVVVLTYGRDSIFLHEEDLNPNSKFQRRSRIRLGLDFVPVPCADETEAEVYRTYRPNGRDYFVHIYTDKVLEHSIRIQKKNAQVAEARKQAYINRQLSWKDIVSPDRDKKLEIEFISENRAIVAIDGEEYKYQVPWDMFGCKRYMCTYELLERLLYLFYKREDYNEVSIKNAPEILRNVYMDIYNARTSWMKEYRDKFQKISMCYGNKKGVGIMFVC
jgi:hypothetical protein